MQLNFFLRFFIAVFALGVLVMLALLIIQRAKPAFKEDDALKRKWKCAFKVSVALVLIPMMISWRLVYRFDERTAFLEESDLFNSVFYYRNNRLAISSIFLMRVFTVMIILGVLGIIALLIISKVKPAIKEDVALIRKWKRAFAVFVAFVLIPVLIISIGS